MASHRRGLIAAMLIAFCAEVAVAQGTAPQPGQGAVRKTGESTYEIGMMKIDTAKRELVVPGFINRDVDILEFVANTREGHKAYESAITVDANAVRFNAALLLLGVDPGRARVPTKHFDPVPPAGDLLDVFVEWDTPSPRRVRVEELLFDKRTNQTLPAGPWVYTGSTFVNTGTGRSYLADIDGVLIGFVHSPAPIIENPRPGAVDAYGSVVMNQKLGLKPGTPVRLIVVALPRTSGRAQ